MVLDTLVSTNVFDDLVLCRRYDLIAGFARLKRLDVPIIMMTLSNGNIFRVTGPLCKEFRSPANSLTEASDAELWCFLWFAPWINGWVNNREAGDLRRHRAHYDVIVMGMHTGGVWLTPSDIQITSMISLVNSISTSTQDISDYF